MAEMGLHSLFHEKSLPAIWTGDRREYKKTFFHNILKKSIQRNRHNYYSPPSPAANNYNRVYRFMSSVLHNVHW
jgi:hypothetical protein